jgi:type II secretory pathway component PulF
LQRPKHPLYFDDLFVNLVEAGEQAGALETLLDKVATYKEKTEAIKKKIKKALTYPMAVLVVAFVVTFCNSCFRRLVQRIWRGPPRIYTYDH